MYAGSRCTPRRFAWSVHPLPFGAKRPSGNRQARKSRRVESLPCPEPWLRPLGPVISLSSPVSLPPGPRHGEPQSAKGLFLVALRFGRPKAAAKARFRRDCFVREAIRTTRFDCGLKKRPPSFVPGLLLLFSPSLPSSRDAVAAELLLSCICNLVRLSVLPPVALQECRWVVQADSGVCVLQVDRYVSICGRKLTRELLLYVSPDFVAANVRQRRCVLAERSFFVSLVI
ncbi:hypothetical protein BDY21DRAFT_332584 [Lineolata rhizophorae]|uniref:Uncharacterized protein n=1 Tax=Lineolata rhizophorae TaxID=578093 RepID=A0A6A6PCV7_9PEZI|nr:hypothetical protein BDY21DRAFT_332584 [Lineolata rhizophorae]